MFNDIPYIVGYVYDSLENTCIQIMHNLKYRNEITIQDIVDECSKYGIDFYAISNNIKQQYLNVIVER